MVRGCADQCYKFAKTPPGSGDRYAINRFCGKCQKYVPLSMIRCECCRYITRGRSRSTGRIKRRN